MVLNKGDPFGRAIEQSVIVPSIGIIFKFGLLFVLVVCLSNSLV